MKRLHYECSQIALKLINRIQSPTATFQEICDLIKLDQGLSAKIIRLANTSYYFIPGGVKDIATALKYVGVTTIVEIVLTQSGN